mgnify:CR=1 FL=1
MRTAIRNSVRLTAGFGLLALLAACDSGTQDRATDGEPGGLVIEEAYVRDNPGPAPTAAAYMTIRNTGGSADTLVGVATPDAGMASLHRVVESDGMTRMRHSEGLEIPAGGSLRLAPGEQHIMLMQVKRTLAPGDTVAMTLEFETAPAQTLQLQVRALGDENGA